MHPKAEPVRRFHTSVRDRDAAEMAACDHPDVEFSDEVFPGLKGPRAGAVWRMLCERGKDLEVRFRDVEAAFAADRRASVPFHASAPMSEFRGGRG